MRLPDRRIVCALAALLLTTHASAQAPATGPDPRLCESLKVAMAAAPQGKWPSPPGVSLVWEGGQASCRSAPDGQMLRCEFFSRQMVSPDSCKTFRAPTSEEIASDSAGATYAQSRVIPTLQTCFSGVTPTPHQKRTENYIENGLQMTMPGQPVIRLVETNSRTTLLGDLCVINTAEVQIDPRP